MSQKKMRIFRRIAVNKPHYNALKKDYAGRSIKEKNEITEVINSRKEN